MERQNVDYMQVLAEPSFQRFARMRDLRTHLAKEEATPPYTIFSDEELAALAKLDELTPATMKSVKGIGDKKVEKYGARFIQAAQQHEKS